MRVRPRQGAALIEVMIGLVILATAGSALLAALGQAQHAQRILRDTERRVDSASVLLDAMTVWDRNRYVERVGWSNARTFAIHIEQVTPSVFDVVVAAQAGGSPIVATTVYRRVSGDAP